MTPQDPVNPPGACPCPRPMATMGVAADQRLRVSLFQHLDAPQGIVTPAELKIEVVGLGGELRGPNRRTETGRLRSETLPGPMELAGSGVALPGFIDDRAPINCAIRVWNGFEAA